MKTANCRITEKYRAHLAEIAGLYVESAGNKAAAERAVRERVPDCGSFKQQFLPRWMENPEFAALVKEAEDGKANALRLRPTVRGPERIAWLLGVEKELKGRLEGVEDHDAKDKALRALLNVGAEIRAEELHFESLQGKIAQRDFARFVKNLVGYVKARHAAAHMTLFPVLRDVLNNIERVQSGKFEAD
jgi:hypothetical protein